VAEKKPKPRAKKKAEPAEQAAPKPNREERRRQKFRPKDTSKRDTDPLAKGNPAFGTGDDTESYAGRPDQGIVKTTGAGTGGATQSEKGVKEHAARHGGNVPGS
jgi:hypothetical protein